jgi:hypothetical protein
MLQLNSKIHPTDVKGHIHDHRMQFDHPLFLLIDLVI